MDEEKKNSSTEPQQNPKQPISYNKNMVGNLASKGLQSKLGRKVIKNAAPVIGGAIGGPAGAAAGQAVKKALDNPAVDKMLENGGKALNKSQKKSLEKENKDTIPKVNEDEKESKNSSPKVSEETKENKEKLSNILNPKSKLGMLGTAASLVGKTRNKIKNYGKNIQNKFNQTIDSLPEEESFDDKQDDSSESLKDKNSKSNNKSQKEKSDNNDKPTNENKKFTKNILLGRSTSFKLTLSVIAPLIPFIMLFIVIILALLIIIFIISGIVSDNIYDYNENADVNCVNSPTCNTVIIPDGPSAGTYTIDEYLAGAVNYYFGSYTSNAEDYHALGVVVNSDLLINSSINSGESTCTLKDTNKYTLLNIPENNTESTDDSQDNITNAVSLSKSEIIIGYAPKIELDLSALNQGTNYDETIKKLFKVEKLELEPFEIFPICDMYQPSPELSYVDVNGCDNVTVTEGEYTGTYTLDDYVAGVISHEVGGFQDTETFKAFSVAARTYLFTRSQNTNGVCYITSSTNTQAFRPTTNQQIIDAVSQTTGQIMTDGAGNLVSTEYDAFCYESKDSTNYYLAQKHQAIPIAWAYENVPKWSGTSYLEHPCGTDGDGGHGRGMSQYGAYYMSTVQGKLYNEILNFYYDNAVLSSSLKNYNLNGEVNSYGLMYPLETTGNCSSKFGNRVHPISGVQKNHNGIDIARPENTPIYAAQDGVVAINGFDEDGWGNYVKITGNNGLDTLYAHMVKPSTLQVGQTITAGTLIGYVGDTGAATGNHLHFEIYENGTRVDPLKYLPGLCG